MDRVEIEEQYPAGVILSEASVDPTTAIISNAKLLGAVSKNGRVYSKQALADAARLYRGAQFYVDHPTDNELRERRGVRRVRDLAGKVMAPRVVGAEVRGDLHLIPDDANTQKILRIAEHMPEIAGNSHRAIGTVRKADGQTIVESIESVQAVEFVTSPATSEGLFESRAITEPTDPSPTSEPHAMDFSTLTLDQLREQRPDLLKSYDATTSTAAELKQLRDDNAAMKKTIDEQKARDAERDHKAMVDKVIAEAGLPDRLVTDVFRETLYEAKDEQAVKRLVEDRATLRTTGVPKPKSVEKDPSKKLQQDVEGQTPIAEADLSGLGLKLVPVEA